MTIAIAATLFIMVVWRHIQMRTSPSAKFTSWVEGIGTHKNGRLPAAGYRRIAVRQFLCTMEPPPPKKRRLAAPVAVVSRRTTRSQKPRLNAELLAKVATYSSLGRDLLNLCVVAGPRDCAVIRHAYLRKNLRYLEASLFKCFKFGAKEDDDPGWPWLDQGLCRDRYLAWMEVNTDWRRLVTAERVGSLVSVYKEDNDGIYPNDDPLLPFNNPAVAIEIGLMDPLRHLVEEMGIDVNSYHWITFRFDRVKLLLQCVECDNFSAFQYLLGKETIEICAKADEDEGLDGTSTTGTILEQCFCAPNRTAFFRELLRHPACSLDVGFATLLDGVPEPIYAHAAIEIMRGHFCNDLFHSSTWNANFRLLLEAGVDMGAKDPVGNDIFRHIHLTEVSAGPLLQKALKDALQILEDWVATK